MMDDAPKPKWCSQCKREKPATAFPTPPKNFRVRFCTECVVANVAKWKRTQMVGKLVIDFDNLE